LLRVRKLRFIVVTGESEIQRDCRKKYTVHVLLCCRTSTTIPYDHNMILCAWCTQAITVFGFAKIFAASVTTPRRITLKRVSAIHIIHIILCYIIMKKVESDIVTMWYCIMAIAKPRSATAAVLSYHHNNNNNIILYRPVVSRATWIIGIIL